ncbi:g2360 [Coccomyxa viridis]|uniref:Prefoldin subunit 4 n=1 Tax=Coccomyxa viridis TaxID=1274662 RepID=A0ABP1FK63_9CHLO
MSGALQASPSSRDVDFEDQQAINKFNRLFNRSGEIEAELKAKKTLVDDLEDASNELMLADEEEVRFSVGDCFYHASPDEAEEKLQEASKEAQDSVESLERELDGLKEDMSDLKKVLYGKLGDSINLD